MAAGNTPNMPTYGKLPVKVCSVGTTFRGEILRKREPLSDRPDDAPASVARRVAERFFDADQLVVFRQPV